MSERMLSAMELAIADGVSFGTEGAFQRLYAEGYKVVPADAAPVQEDTMQPEPTRDQPPDCWWRVVDRDGKVAWVENPPHAKMDSAWEGGSIYGPYVHAYAEPPTRPSSDETVEAAARALWEDGRGDFGQEWDELSPAFRVRRLYAARAALSAADEARGQR